MLSGTNAINHTNRKDTKEMAYQGVKFKTIYLANTPPSDPRVEELAHWCRKFDQLRLAPPYEGGSYGNLSFRLDAGSNEFIITGSMTSLGTTDLQDSFVLVKDVDTKNTTLSVEGTREPSSEAMLHFAIYKAMPQVNAVFHGHSQELMRAASALGIPQTTEFKPYGTMELVESVLEIVHTAPVTIMTDHGFIATGTSMQEAGQQSIQALEKSKSV